MNENIIQIIKNIFDINNLNIYIKGVKKAPFNIEIKASLQGLKSINKLNLIIKTLEKILNTNIKYNFNENNIILYIESHENIIINNFDYILKKGMETNPENKNNDLIFLGIDKTTNTPIFESLNNTKSILVGGTSGCGKSILLHNIILSYLLLNKENYLFLIDPKFTEFSFYNKRILKNRLVFESGNSFQDYIKILSFLENVLKSRFQTMKKKQIQKSTESPILLVVDEYAQLFQNIKEKKIINNYIMKLSSLGRACNIFLILATQHPTNENINNTIRANLQSRICLKCENIQQSKNIIDTTEATRITNAGEGVLKIDGKIQKYYIKSCMISNESIKKYLK